MRFYGKARVSRAGAFTNKKKAVHLLLHTQIDFVFTLEKIPPCGALGTDLYKQKKQSIFCHTQIRFVWPGKKSLRAARKGPTITNKKKAIHLLLLTQIHFVCPGKKSLPVVRHEPALTNKKKQSTCDDPEKFISSHRWCKSRPTWTSESGCHLALRNSPFRGINVLAKSSLVKRNHQQQQHQQQIQE